MAPVHIFIEFQCGRWSIRLDELIAAERSMINRARIVGIGCFIEKAPVNQGVIRLCLRIPMLGDIGVSHSENLADQHRIHRSHEPLFETDVDKNGLIGDSIQVPEQTENLFPIGDFQLPERTGRNQIQIVSCIDEYPGRIDKRRLAEPVVLNVLDGRQQFCALPERERQVVKQIDKRNQNGGSEERMPPIPVLAAHA